jgi:hypothetical protein
MLQLDQTNTYGDKLHYLVFHYDRSAEVWQNQSWYVDSSQIVMKKSALACKAEAWVEVMPDFVGKYDYVWLLDGDLSFATFSWDLYRSVLVRFQPLVSQPSIVGREDIPTLRFMKPRMHDGRAVFPFMLEMPRTEIMAPVLSTRIWRAFHNRIQHNDNKVASKGINDWWDIIAMLGKTYCDKLGPLLINVAPVRRVDFHDLTDQKIGAKDCRRGTCGGGDNQESNVGPNCRSPWVLGHLRLQRDF